MRLEALFVVSRHQSHPLFIRKWNPEIDINTFIENEQEMVQIGGYHVCSQTYGPLILSVICNVKHVH